MLTCGAPSRLRSLAASSAPSPRLSMKVTPSRSIDDRSGASLGVGQRARDVFEGEGVQDSAAADDGRLAPRLDCDLDVLRGHGAAHEQGHGHPHRAPVSGSLTPGSSESGSV